MAQSKKTFVKYVCWALLFAFVFLGLPKMCMSHGHHHDHDHDHGHSHVGSKPVVNDLALWTKALLSTVAISVVPFFVLFFIPINNKDEHQSFLKVLLSFASGGLLGDAFLHLIPHSLSTHDHNHHQDEHDHHHHHGHEESCSAAGPPVHNHDNETRVGMWILGGILVFLFVEKMVRVLKGGHSHSHSSNQPKEKLSDDEDDEAVGHVGEFKFIVFSFIFKQVSTNLIFKKN